MSDGGEAMISRVIAFVPLAPWMVKLVVAVLRSVNAIDRVPTLTAVPCPCHVRALTGTHCPRSAANIRGFWQPLTPPMIHA